MHSRIETMLRTLARSVKRIYARARPANAKHAETRDANEPKPFEDIPGPISLPIIGTLYKYIPSIGKNNIAASHHGKRKFSAGNSYICGRRKLAFINLLFYIVLEMQSRSVFDFASACHLLLLYLSVFTSINRTKNISARLDLNFNIPGEYSFIKLHKNGLLKLKRYGPLVQEEIVPGQKMVWVFRPEDIAAIFKAETGTHPERKSHLALLQYRQNRSHIYKTGGLLPT